MVGEYAEEGGHTRMGMGEDRNTTMTLVSKSGLLYWVFVAMRCDAMWEG
jgi:hypothetical protein